MHLFVCKKNLQDILFLGIISLNDIGSVFNAQNYC